MENSASLLHAWYNRDDVMLYELVRYEIEDGELVSLVS